MKVKKIWIATHSQEPMNREVSLTEPGDKYTTLYNELTSNEPDYSAEWKECVYFEVED